MYFVRFIDTGFCKFDEYKHVQSANIVQNVLRLCLRLLHGTVATKRMYGRKFLFQVLWHSFAKSCTKHENPSIICSTVVLKCYRRQAIPMEQAKIRPFVTLYSLDRSLSNLVWFIKSVIATQMPILVKFGWQTSLWLFCSVLFYVVTPRGKPLNGFARIMVQNAWNQPRMCLLGVSSKNGHPTRIIIMWLVQSWTLPFVRACSMPVDSALGGRRLLARPH